MGRRTRGESAFILPLGLSAVLVVLLAWLTHEQSTNGNRIDPPHTELSKWTALFVTLSLIGAIVGYWWAHRPRASTLAAASAFVLAIGTVALGLATYAPCAQGWRLFTGPLGWTLELFVGAVEAPPSAGAACAAMQLPGFTLARTFGLLATFAGAISAAAVLGRSQFDRRQVRRGSDVDAVIGLNSASLALVKALVDERHHAPRRETWIDWRPGLIRRWLDGPEPDVPSSPLFERVHPGQPAPPPAPRDPDTSLLYNLTGLRKGDVRRWRTPPTKIVVLEPDEQNALVSEAREAGAIVVNVDPTETAILRGVATHRPWFGLGRRRLSLRRMFIVTDSQQANIDIHRHAVNTLHDDLGPHPRDVVPRLFVRIDDHRFAHQWRIENLSDSAARGHHVTHFSDGLTNTDAVAEAIVEQFIPAVESVQWRVDEIILIGDDPLAVQLLEELAWQQWCRYEVAYAAHKNLQDQMDALRAGTVFWVDPAVEHEWSKEALTGDLDIRARTSRDSESVQVRVLRTPQNSDDIVGLLGSEKDGIDLTGEPADVQEVLKRLAHQLPLQLPQRLALLAKDLEPRLEHLARAAHPNLRTVVLAGPKAQERVDEWNRTCHPWSLGAGVEPPLKLFSVTASAGDWEQRAGESMKHADTAVVFVEDRSAYRSAAARLSRTNPEDLVGMRDDATVGLALPIATGAPFRFGTCLTRRPSAVDASRVPVDSLARLARQQHTVYSGRWPTLPPEDHLRSAQVPKITSGDWPSLPEFFQEDNVRQHRALLGWFVQKGYRWVTATAGSAPAYEMVTDAQLEALVRNEYNRWSGLRHQRGWVPVEDPSQRDDRLRRHQDLQGLEFVDMPFNKDLMTQIMNRLWAIGLTVEPHTRLE